MAESYRLNKLQIKLKQKLSNNKSINGYRVFTILTGSMKNVYDINDVVLVKEINKDKLKEGDKLVLSFDYEEDNSNIIPNEMPLDIVYEDDWYLIINKPSGIAVHPSILHYEDSLSNGIRFYFDSIRSKEKN